MREKNIEKYLTSSIKKIGGRSYKWVSPGNNGVPDRIVILKGRVIFVEVKNVSGRLSSLQKIQIKRLKELGQDVRVVYGMGEVEDLVKELSFEI